MYKELVMIMLVFCFSYVGAEEDLLTVLANHGPVAVAVDATNWQYYVGGVIQWNCDANNNHAVQVSGHHRILQKKMF